MTEGGDVVRLTIDGREVEALAGRTIFEAAAGADIRIPNLCSDGRMEPVAACRMCVVHVNTEKDIRTACTTSVEEGMRVTTDSEKLREHRRLILELILSDHNAYCLPPCQNGCPDQLDIPGYVKAVAWGDPREAVRNNQAALALSPLAGTRLPPALRVGLPPGRERRAGLHLHHKAFCR